jgi:hypothetical protein
MLLYQADGGMTKCCEVRLSTSSCLNEWFPTQPWAPSRWKDNDFWWLKEPENIHYALLHQIYTVCIWCLVSLPVTATYTPQVIHRRLDENLKNKPPHDARNGSLIAGNKPTGMCIRKAHSTTTIGVSQQLNTWDGNKMAWMTGKVLK